MIGDLVDKRLESVPRNFLRDREWHTEVLEGEVCYLARQKQFGSLDVCNIWALASTWLGYSPSPTHPQRLRKCVSSPADPQSAAG
jgi:hypothetical protein